MDVGMDKKQKKVVFFLILAMVVGALVGWKLLPSWRGDDAGQSEDMTGLTKIKVGEVELWVEIADTVEKKSLGLGGRDSLPPDQGMIFIYDEPGVYGFWMKGMKFPLDFVWISAGKVVEVTQNVPPLRQGFEGQASVYQPQVPIEAMVEANAGWVKQNDVKIGDEVVY